MNRPHSQTVKLDSCGRYRSHTEVEESRILQPTTPASLRVRHPRMNAAHRYRQAALPPCHLAGHLPTLFQGAPYPNVWAWFWLPSWLKLPTRLTLAGAFSDFCFLIHRPPYTGNHQSRGQGDSVSPSRQPSCTLEVDPERSLARAVTRALSRLRSGQLTE